MKAANYRINVHVNGKHYSWVASRNDTEALIRKLKLNRNGFLFLELINDTLFIPEATPYHVWFESI